MFNEWTFSHSEIDRNDEIACDAFIYPGDHDREAHAPHSHANPAR